MKLIFNTIILASLVLMTSISARSQVKRASHEVMSVGFYNFENLFDTIDSPDTRDEEFTPNGSNRYDGDKYRTKLQNLSQVVAELGTDYDQYGLALLGVAEIENRSVLEDFVKQKRLRKRNYQIVHHESPDRRGIDVALLFNPRYFKLTSSKTLGGLFINELDTFRTRHVLYVIGELNGELTHILINHWPSRSGGEKRSMPRRAACASICRQVYDSLRLEDPLTKVIVMGDLNDNPNSPSIKDYLRATGKMSEVKPYEMYNPMTKPFKKGLGSNAWRDTWSLFDQIIFSYGYTQCEESGHCFLSSKIYNPKYMRQIGGRYAGYPFRTYAGGQFTGGYSDHFPVFAYIAKEKTP